MCLHPLCLALTAHPDALLCLHFISSRVVPFGFCSHQQEDKLHSPRGKLLLQEQVQAMKSSGSATTQIRWMNPTTKRVGDAEVELKRIDGKEVFIGSPWFK